MPLSDGLRIELGLFAHDPKFRNVDADMQKRFDRAAKESEQNDRKRKKTLKERLYRITPLRKAVHGIKRVFKRS